MTVPNIPLLFGNCGAEYHRSDLLFPGTHLKVFWESSYTREFFYNWEMTKLNPRRIPSSLSHDAGWKCLSAATGTRWASRSRTSPTRRSSTTTMCP